MCVLIKDLQRSVVDRCANKGLSSKNASLVKSTFTHFQSLTTRKHKPDIKIVRTFSSSKSPHTPPNKPHSHAIQKPPPPPCPFYCACVGARMRQLDFVWR